MKRGRLQIIGLILAFASVASSQIIMPNPIGGSGGGSSTVTAGGISTATTCVDAGANDTYTCNLPTAPTYTDGFWAAFKANTANTGTASINFNSVGALTIVRKTTTISTALVTGDIRAGQWVEGFYDGTNFQCVTCDGSVAYYNTANAWTGTQTISAGIGLNMSSAGNIGRFVPLTTLTPDAAAYETGALSNSFRFHEQGDSSFDFNNGACGTSACTDPGLIVSSAVQDTTQYNHMSAWGFAGASIKALTAGAATSVIQIPVASGAGTGGSLRYSIFASDATDHQLREGEIKFAVVNKAGTETCTISGASELLDGSVLASSSGTLTYAITCSTSPSNAVDIQFNAVSSLTETTLNAYYKVNLIGPGQPARQ
jgi:hypothetical protein